MPFFPSYKDSWTRTPNVFFDQILKYPHATINQIRLIGFLIRNTLGYNKEAKWTGITRSTLIKAGITNSRIRDALIGCEKNNWILIFEDGYGTKKERYVFLNDDLNFKIVSGLRQGKFTVSNLEYLNIAGIDELLKKHDASPETGEGNIYASPETGEATTPETGEATTPETGEADKGQSESAQPFAEPLKTIFKDKRFKDIFKRQRQQHVVVSYQNKIKKYLDLDLSFSQTENLLQVTITQNKNFLECIYKTKEVIAAKTAKGEYIANPVGILQYEIQTGWNLDNISELKIKNESQKKGKSIAMQMIDNQEKGIYTLPIDDISIPLTRKKIKSKH